jgi:hypothetical protein
MPMTTDEIEILLANTISEINRLSTSVENIRQVLVEVLSQEQTHKDRERLKGILAPYQSDAQSHWLFAAGQRVRERFDKEQTAQMDLFFQAGLKLPR